MNKLIRKYNKDGYLVIKNLLSVNEIKTFEHETKKISKILVSEFKRPYVNLTKDGKVNTAHNLNKLFPKSALSRIVTKKKIIQNLLFKLFKEKPVLRNLEMFLKPPKTGMAAPWHQDNFYWNINDSKAVNIWVALDKVSSANGGLVYLKGSHVLGTIKHSPSGAKGSSQEIKNNIINKLNFPKSCPKLSVGDCIIHHSEIIHGSKKNTSSLGRRGVVLSYKSKSSKINRLKLSKYISSLKKQL